MNVRAAVSQAGLVLADHRASHRDVTHLCGARARGLLATSKQHLVVHGHLVLCSSEDSWLPALLPTTTRSLFSILSPTLSSDRPSRNAAAAE
jgi:hypothetical protein